MSENQKTKQQLLEEIRELRTGLDKQKQKARDLSSKISSLEKTKEQFEVLTNAVPEIIYETDKNGKLIFINMPAMELTGYTWQDFEKGIHAMEMVAPPDRERARELFEILLNGGQVQPDEFLAQKKDKTTFPVLVKSTPILRDGKIQGVRGIIFDLTKHKKDEEIQQYYERKRQFIMRSVNVEIALLDKDGRYLFVNEYCASQLKQNADEIIGKTLYDSFSKEIVTEQLKNIRHVLKTEKPLQHEMELEFDGSKRWYFANLQPFYSSHEKCESVMVFAHNITQRKETEEKLYNSERMAQTLIDAANESIFLLDRELNILTVNKAAARRLNKTEDQLRGQNVKRLTQSKFSGNYADNRLRQIEYVIKSGKSVRFIDKRANIYFDTSIFPIFDKTKNVQRIAIFGRDITDIKKSEQAIRESEERLRTVIQNMPVMMCAFDENKNIISWNRECEEITGYSSEEIVGNPNAIKILYPNNKQRNKFLTKWQKRGDDFRNWEWPLISKNSQQKIIAWSNISWLYPIPGWASWQIGFDVTEQKRIQDALSKSEEQYRLVFENATEAIIVIQNRRLKFFNSRTEEFTGYTHAELKNIQIFKLLHSADKKMAIHLYHRSTSQRDNPQLYELRIINKQGKLKWMKIGGVTINWNGKPAMLNFISDMTEQKEIESERIKLQEQLLQTQKLDLIGRLTSGIAHDFNNLLSPIISYATITLMEQSQKNHVTARLKQILETAKRARNLTRHLLAFSRKQKMIMKPINLNEEINQFETILKHLIDRNIDLKIILSEDIDMIIADSSQLHQILMNLVINAQEAMPSGGKLIIETANISLDGASSQSHHDSLPNRHVMLAVSDTGHGMEQQMMDKIFEPFFTTKIHLKGSGLGLSTVNEIIKEHKARICVYSEPDRGTTFKIYFPSAKVNHIEETDKIAINIKSVVKTDDTVLIVDDEEVCLYIMQEILEKPGYTILTARTAKEALQLDKQNSGKLKLLVTDLIMPDLNGDELYKKLQQNNPDLRVLFISGYSEEIISHHDIDTHGSNFLQKPFSAKNFILKVNKIMEKE